MLTSLSTEIIVEILLKLDYLTLHGPVSLTCRRLRDIIQDAASGKRDGELPRILFASPAADSEALAVLFAKFPKYVDGSTNWRDAETMVPDVKIHPCLRFLQVKETTCDHEENGVLNGEPRYGIGNIGFYTTSGRFIPLEETRVVKDTVTSPGKRNLLLQVFRGRPTPTGGALPDFKASKLVEGYGTAVTVLDFVKGFSDAMGRGCTCNLSASGSVFVAAEVLKAPFLKKGENNLLVEGTVNLYIRNVKA